MIWDGLSFDEAARKNNFSVQAMRKALDRANVRAYLRNGRQVFRASVGPEIDHRLMQIARQDDHKVAAVAALKTFAALEQQAPKHSSPVNTPGLIIVVEPRQAKVLINQQTRVAELAPTVLEHGQADGDADDGDQ
jgi:hypothetical protein